MDRISFKDQVVIVTGGGRGLGRAYCMELARRGASVVVNDVAGPFADEVVAAILAGGGTALASHDSIATPEGGRAIVQKALDRYGTVDALINNAGILRNNFFEDLTLEQIDAVLDVNLRGVFFVTQPAWRIMKAKGYGRLVMTSSAAGMFSRVGSVNYSASKAAMYGMTRALSFEGRDHGIKINMILPRANTTISTENPLPIREPLPPQVSAAITPRRTAEAIAPLVCYLASRGCAVNGEAFSAAYGAFARVFAGRTRGWIARDAKGISVEEVAEHMEAIRDFEGYSVPLSNNDEVLAIAEQLGIVPVPATAKS